MAVNLLQLDEKRFEELCQALLSEEYSRFQALSAPDSGMDGYDSDSQTIFQAYYPEQAPRRDKIANDIEKAKQNEWACKRWVLLLPKNPTPSLLRWLEQEQQPLVPFSLKVWGKTQILALLRKYPKVREAYFPTDWRREFERVARGKTPRVGDAGPGEEVSPEQAAELRQLIVRLAEQEAERRHRKPRSSDFGPEYGEFNSRFQLSSYDRLPASKFEEARRYLERKLYAKREREPQYLKRNRCRKGIHAIKRKLRMGDAEYRAVLLEVTGKDSTELMSIDELEHAFRRFQELQGLAETEINRQ
jgi:hypothetical protein